MLVYSGLQVGSCGSVQRSICVALRLISKNGVTCRQADRASRPTIVVSVSVDGSATEIILNTCWHCTVEGVDRCSIDGVHVASATPEAGFTPDKEALASLADFARSLHRDPRHLQMPVRQTAKSAR